MTTFIAHKKGIEICEICVLVFWLTILCCFLLFIGLEARKQAKVLTLRNAADSLILLVELEDESGSNFIRAKDEHAEMLRQYTRLMEGRHPYPFLLVPLFSKNNIVKELKRAAKDLGGELSPESEADQQKEARKRIEAASKAIAEFFSKSKPFTDEPSIAFVPEAIPEEIRTAIVESLKESHENVDMYAEDTNMANSEAAHQANRKAIVYLYAARYGYQKTVSQETLRQFRTDMNRAVYYNRALQQTDAIKGGKGVKDSDYWLLDRRSCSDILRLRLLQLIIDNDIQQAQALLQIAVSGHGGHP